MLIVSPREGTHESMKGRLLCLLGLHLLVLTSGTALPDVTEGFETGNFTALPWTFSSSRPWTVVSTDSHGGTYSAKAGSISGNALTSMEVSRQCVSGVVSFWRMVSSEAGFDSLTFYIDDVLQGSWSGESDWIHESFPVSSGTRTFRWTYGKNVTGTAGRDTAWIDDIAFPTAAFWCDFSCDTSQGFSPVEVVFRSELFGTPTAGVCYWWDFDGNGEWDVRGAELDTVTNVYTRCGTWAVSLMVSNAVGNVYVETKRECVTAGTATVFVSPRGTHTSPYTNWVAAATNIQSAVDVSVDGTEIWVTDGYYSITSEVRVPRACRLVSLAGAGKTVVDGNMADRCFYLTPGAVLDGFTIMRGAAGEGGGVYCDGGGSITDCVISNCVSTTVYGGYGLHWGGGGVFLRNGGTVEDCVIAGNISSNEGGGVFCDTAGVVERCVIRDNYAHDDGGGACLADGGVLRNCLIVKNTAWDNGGGLQTAVAGTVENCTIANNRCSLEYIHHGGGGLYRRLGGVYRNCIFYGNRAGPSGSPSYDNYFIYSGSPFTSCCSTPLPPGTGNISDDPLFWDPADDDWRLRATSPCIDQGTALNHVDLDLVGCPRPIDGDADGSEKWDMGAYEFVNRFILVTTTSSATEGDGVLSAAGTASLLVPPTVPLTIQLLSSDTSEVVVAESLTVPAGERYAVFDVVVVDDADHDSVQTALISASATGFVARGSTITVADNEVATLAVRLPGSVREGDNTLPAAGWATMDTVADADIEVSLASDDVTELRVPATVTIPEGQSSNAFDLIVQDDGVIDGAISVAVTAHVTNWTDGAATVSVLDDESLQLVISVPSEVREDVGTLPAAGTVSLSGTVTDAVVVALASDTPAVVQVPESVAIAKGSREVRFDLTVVDDWETGQTQIVSVSASATGFVGAVSAIRVTDNDPHAFAFEPVEDVAAASSRLQVRILAVDGNGALVTPFNGAVELSATADGGVEPIAPQSSGSFVAGWWGGYIPHRQVVASNVILRATDGHGHIGFSNPFDILAPLTLYVSKDGLHQSPYTNWAAAATNIQDAVDCATEGGLVLVADGVYSTGTRETPSQSAPGNRLVVPAGVSVCSVNGPNDTAIEGSGTRGADPIRCVFLLPNSRLSGFTLRQGRTLPSGSNAQTDGGGAFAEGATLDNCVIVGSYAGDRGGGVRGGTLYNCVLRDNRAVNDGAGACYSTLHRCSLMGNVAEDDGGGASRSTLYNCLVSANRAGDNGGGIHDSSAHHCTVVSNSASGDGGGVEDCDVASSIVHGNTGSGANHDSSVFVHSCTTPLPAGTGNIAREPGFLPGTNYYLAPASPCIDTGGNSGIASDLKGRHRPLDGNNDGIAFPDMGAYEFVHVCADSDCDGMDDIDEIVSGTSPTNASDCLRILGMTVLAGRQVMRWPTVEGHLDTVQTSTGGASTAWVSVADAAYVDMPGNGGVVSFTNTPHTQSCRFFRVLTRKSTP